MNSFSRELCEPHCCNDVNLVSLGKMLADPGKAYLRTTVHRQFIIAVFFSSKRHRKIFKPLVHVRGFSGVQRVSTNDARHLRGGGHLWGDVEKNGISESGREASAVPVTFYSLKNKGEANIAKSR